MWISKRSRNYSYFRDGHVSLDELESVLRNMGFRPTRSEVSQILKEGDTNGNGTLELKEFIDLMARIQPEEEKEEKEEKEPKKAKKSPQKKQPKKGKAKKEEKEGKEEKEEEEEVPKIERGNSILQLERTGSTVKMARGLSISDFYTTYAGYIFHI